MGIVAHDFKEKNVAKERPHAMPSLRINRIKINKIPLPM
jgi:hypothetical protein